MSTTPSLNGRVRRVRQDYRLPAPLVDELRRCATTSTRTVTAIVERALRRHLATKEAWR